jgi:hypothetical protein
MSVGIVAMERDVRIATMLQIGELRYVMKLSQADSIMM